MYIKNSQPHSNLSSIREKASNSSIGGASIGHKKTSSHFNPASVNTNLRTTSHGGAFKKAVGQKSKTGVNSREPSPMHYIDDSQNTEVAQFEKTERFSQIEPSQMGQKGG